MNKKNVTQILDDLNSVHPLYDDRKYYHTPIKCTSMLVLPLIDNQVPVPYSIMSLTPLSDYQRDVLKTAADSRQPIFMVPESEFVEYMPDEIIASRFKGCRGVVGLPLQVHAASDTAEAEYHVQCGFQGTVTMGSWSGDLAVASILETELVPIPHTAEQDEVGLLLNDTFDALLNFLIPDTRKELRDNLNNIPDNTLERLSFMTLNSPADTKERAQLLFTTDLQSRRELLLTILSQHTQKLKLREDVQRRTMQQLTEKQKTEFLRTQIRNMQQEMNIEIDENDDEELRQRADNKDWSEETRQAFDKEMRKLLRYASNTPEYAMQYQYLDTFLNLPWQHCDNNDFELKDVEDILNRDHYALDKVKERIVEQMAVLKLRHDTKAPILCLVGPPGVGKTSLGKSVAEALGRKYVRVALGGVHDEAEIRGHRRTYLGAMPGRIISALEKCGTSDPVMVLDEIDKLGADYKGDPQTALLEVLDPEQNNRFHDNYIDHDYDLSNILFIATANSLDPVSAPLLDRMEVIDIGGYVEDEKVEIARRHLVPRNLERHGFDKNELTFSDASLHEIITYYTRESGVRQLEKRIAEILRKLARRKVSNQEFSHNISAPEVRELLGKQSNYPDKYEDNKLAGVVTGLAWTQAGGEILFIESSLAPAKDFKLTLTGNLGDVMKESAVLALGFLKAHAEKFKIDPKVFEARELHIHVPEGAIPKDGPSAGITMLTSIASALTNRKVRAKIAMTGELTLRGKVLPVGGIKEKILAAKRAGIQDVVLCEQNRKDIEEIPSKYLEGMTFHYVGSASEVLDFALLEELAD